ncbi:MAG TPA: hypothetical protein VLU24_00710 [Mycobacterium sp.]|nr:hypothetical protein [Mycobacterium sp.]
MAEHPLDAYAGCWALVTGSARREGLLSRRRAVMQMGRFMSAGLGKGEV